MYGIEFTWPRFSSSIRTSYERLNRRVARLVTGAPKNASAKYLLPVAGMTSFEWRVCRAVARMDELLIRHSPDFCRASGVYEPTTMTEAELSDCHDIGSFARLLLTEMETDDGTRSDPRPSFLQFAATIDGSAHLPGMGRATMRRAPIQASAPIGKPGFPLRKALDNISAVRYNLEAPGGLTAHPPSSADPTTLGEYNELKLAACMRKLSDDERTHGVPDLDFYTDGAALLDFRRGSGAAWACWRNSDPVWKASTPLGLDGLPPMEMRKSQASLLNLVTPAWKSEVGPAGAGACSYTAEGSAVVSALRWMVANPRDVSGRSIRIVLDGLSFAMALEKGPLSQREYLETLAWEELAELTAAPLNCKIAFVSIFAHCGLHRNEFVDHLAERFMQSSTPSGLRASLQPRPMVVYDCVNLRMRDRHHLPSITECPFGREDESGQPLIITRFNMGFVDIEKLGLPRQREVFLLRLRMLCSPEIGEVCHNRDPSRCPLCDSACMHRENAVKHMFECQDEAAKAIIAAHSLELKHVPDNDMATAVLELADLFARPDRSDTDSDTEDGSSESDDGEDGDVAEV